MSKAIRPKIEALELPKTGADVLFQWYAWRVTLYVSANKAGAPGSLVWDGVRIGSPARVVLGGAADGTPVLLSGTVNEAVGVAAVVEYVDPSTL